MPLHVDRAHSSDMDAVAAAAALALQSSASLLIRSKLHFI